MPVYVHMAGAIIYSLLMEIKWKRWRVVPVYYSEQRLKTHEDSASSQTEQIQETTGVHVSSYVNCA